MEETNLKQQTLAGMGWTFLENFLRYGITFLVTIVLARLLSPAEYGLLGIIVIFTSLFATLVDSGLSTAIIRKEAVSEIDYSTIFIANFVLSVLLYIVLYLIAPLISGYFANEQLTILTRVTSLILIVNALSIVQKTKLTKEINFKTQTKVSVIAAVLSGVIGIVCALCKMGVWSLVAQLLSNGVFTTVFLIYYTKWFPRINFSYTIFKELFCYSWKLMSVGIISSLWNNVYNFVLGKFYSPNTLGQYTRAKQFSDLLSLNLINNVIQRVTLPVLSKIQNDIEKRHAVMRKLIRVSFFISSICLIGLSSISGSLIVCILGQKWSMASLILPFLCLSQITYPICAITLNMIAVIGRSDLCLKYEIYKHFFDIIPILLGIYLGVYSMLTACIIVGVIYWMLSSFYAKKYLLYSYREQIKDITPSFVMVSFIGAVVYIISLAHFSPIITLLLQISAGTILIIIIPELCRFQEYLVIKNIVINWTHKLVNNKENIKR